MAGDVLMTEIWGVAWTIIIEITGKNIRQLR